MPPPRTSDECRRKVSEMISEAVGEDDDGRREGLLKLADQWIDVAKRRGRTKATPSSDWPPGRCE